MPIPDADQIAREIKTTVEALLTSRSAFKERFSDSDEEWGAGGRSGPCASMQGLRAVFGAVAALPEDSELWTIVKPALPSLMNEWATVLEELVASKYGGGPYDTEMLDRLRKEVDRDGSPYTDTVSWSLSTAVVLNYIFPIFQKSGFAIDATFKTRTRNEIAKSLRTLINAQLSGGDGGWNWGALADMNSSHIYFTWSAIQGLADYFDYVLGESAAEIDAPVDAETKVYLESLDPSLEKDATDARDRAARFLRDRYFGTASTSAGLLYADLVAKDTEGRERIVVTNPGSEIPILYFYSYLLEALILSSYDRNDPTVVNTRRAEMDRLYAEIKRRFAVVRPAGAARTLDTDQSTMQLTFFGTVKRTGRLAEVKVKDPSLWPQVLRSLVLYPYYVETPRDADENIVGSTGAYALLLGDRRDAGGGVGALLWDTVAFNLSVSVRALEGLIDVYDYVRLITEKSKGPEPIGDLAQVIAEAIFPHVRNRLRGEAAPLPADAGTQEVATAPAVSDVYIRTLAQDVWEEQAEANFSGATRLFGDRLKTIDPDRAVKRVIGERHETIKSDNPVVFELLRSIIIICTATVSELFAEVLQEAILSAASAKDLAENDRLYRGPDALSNRIAMAVRQVAIHEVEKAQRRETWDLTELIKQIIALAGPTAPAPPPRGAKKGSS